MNLFGIDQSTALRIVALCVSAAKSPTNSPQVIISRAGIYYAYLKDTA